MTTKTCSRGIDKTADISNIANMTKIEKQSDILRAIRGKLNLTQEQLAERLGVSFATVNRWEGGSNAPQKAALEVIAALAREAGIDDTEGDAQTTDTPLLALPKDDRSRVVDLVIATLLDE
jgi:type I restriction enzyme M protein